LLRHLTVFGQLSDGYSAPANNPHPRLVTKL